MSLTEFISRLSEWQKSFRCRQHFLGQQNANNTTEIMLKIERQKSTTAEHQQYMLGTFISEMEIRFSKFMTSSSIVLNLLPSIVAVNGIHKKIMI